MPRPRKCRKVCHLPAEREFIPLGGCHTRPYVTMTVDEYETIRLIDYQGFSQEECSEFMCIARTTVQNIYTNARQKVAKILVEGLPLRIEGGDYQLCDGLEHTCGCGGCKKHKEQLVIQKESEDSL